MTELTGNLPEWQTRTPSSVLSVFDRFALVIFRFALVIVGFALVTVRFVAVIVRFPNESVCSIFKLFVLSW